MAIIYMYIITLICQKSWVIYLISCVLFNTGKLLLDVSSVIQVVGRPLKRYWAMPSQCEISTNYWCLWMHDWVNRPFCYVLYGFMSVQHGDHITHWKFSKHSWNQFQKAWAHSYCILSCWNLPVIIVVHGVYNWVAWPSD